MFALPLRAVVDAAKHARSIAPASRLEMVGRRTLLLSHSAHLITGTKLVSDLALFVRAIAYLATQPRGICSWSQQTIASKELSLVALILAISPRIVYRDAIALERLLRTKFEGTNGLTNRLAAWHPKGRNEIACAGSFHAGQPPRNLSANSPADVRQTGLSLCRRASKLAADATAHCTSSGPRLTQPGPASNRGS